MGKGGQLLVYCQFASLNIRWYCSLETACECVYRQSGLQLLPNILLAILRAFQHRPTQSSALSPLCHYVQSTPLLDVDKLQQVWARMDYRKPMEDAVTVSPSDRMAAEKALAAARL